ncbi:bacteriohemerythrin [Anaeromyxobacter oryzae]|uniref:Hemerythrin n=1 Tax=Anaeromyxobacter oryzae TaxID=2918170 RepID=A0ABM7X0R1_9BACT|nr:bacteriohemerythrin [Anaeromyxobacter oryzae]BDG05340.1 hemerythrin [Anaeromyxobacter oryzae]
MPLQWTPALAVGIDEIDAQHQELFRRAARLLEALKQGRPEELREVIEFLHAYAVEHFGLEEAWMRDVQYPGYVRHKAEHDRFITDLLALAERQQQRLPSAFTALEVNAWLGEWLRRHVSGTDRELGRYLARRTA